MPGPAVIRRAGETGGRGAKGSPEQRVSRSVPKPERRKIAVIPVMNSVTKKISVTSLSRGVSPGSSRTIGSFFITNRIKIFLIFAYSLSTLILAAAICF